MFTDEVEAVQEEARKLTGEGVKIIIGLGHSGYDKDREIAKKVPEIDAVVGGHSNTFLYTGKFDFIPYWVRNDVLDVGRENLLQCLCFFCFDSE